MAVLIGGHFSAVKKSLNVRKKPKRALKYACKVSYSDAIIRYRYGRFTGLCVTRLHFMLREHAATAVYDKRIRGKIRGKFCAHCMLKDEILPCESANPFWKLLSPYITTLPMMSASL